MIELSKKLGFNQMNQQFCWGTQKREINRQKQGIQPARALPPAKIGMQKPNPDLAASMIFWENHEKYIQQISVFFMDFKPKFVGVHPAKREIAPTHGHGV